MARTSTRVVAVGSNFGKGTLYKITLVAIGKKIQSDQSYSCCHCHQSSSSSSCRRRGADNEERERKRGMVEVYCWLLIKPILPLSTSFEFLNRWWHSLLWPGLLLPPTQFLLPLWIIYASEMLNMCGVGGNAVRAGAAVASESAGSRRHRTSWHRYRRGSTEEPSSLMEDPPQNSLVSASSVPPPPLLLVCFPSFDAFYPFYVYCFYIRILSVCVRVFLSFRILALTLNILGVNLP